MTTNELLRRYVTDRSETAFAELVSQHLDLVYSAALRQVNGDAAAAQDVAQAVFTDLARKAPSLMWHASITGWLYTSTRYLAANHRRTEQRRRTHEQEANAMNQLLQSAQPDPAWLELRPLLDDAMHELSPADREAVLLRYFERLPLAQVGVRLGLNENAARKRVERALEKLHTILAKRGVTSTVAALAVLMVERAVAAAPPELAREISAAAVAAAASGTALGWAMLKLAAFLTPKTLIAASAAALIVGMTLAPKLLPTGMGSGSTAARVSARAGIPTPAQSNATEPARAQIAAFPAPATNVNGMILHIVADDTGTPVAGATIECTDGVPPARGGGRGDGFLLRPKELVLTATDQGTAEIPLSRGPNEVLIVNGRAEGFADLRLVWNPKRGIEIPHEYTMRLSHAVCISGQVVNEQGQPVAGAKVTVENRAAPFQSGTQSPGIHGPTWGETVSDANGFWQINRFAKTNIGVLNVWATHPGYATNDQEPRGYVSLGVALEVVNQLLTGTFVYKLDRGITVQGIVVDQEGQPVTNASVQIVSDMRSCATNLSAGTFVLNACKLGMCEIIVRAQGFAPLKLEKKLTNNQAALFLALKRAKPLKLHLMDTNKMPVAHALVRVGDDTGIARFEQVSDANGNLIWDSPPQQTLYIDVEALGYTHQQGVSIEANGEEQPITLHAARAIRGSVRDAASRLAVSSFRVRACA